MSTFPISRRALLLASLPTACGLASGPAASEKTVSSIAELSTLLHSGLPDGTEVRVTDEATGGRFRWKPDSVVPPDGALIVAAAGASRGRWLRVFPDTINVRWFGASPGASAEHNSQAFAAASLAISRLRGGTLLVPPGEYRVGRQILKGKMAAALPRDIIKIDGCTRPVVIQGAGVTLKAADGLKFGSFDPLTGKRFDPPTLPFTDWAYRVDAYIMIHVRNCRGPVHIEGFNLDGNLEKYVLGGQWDNAGRQIYALGILLDSNTGGVTVAKVSSHHHGLDGIMVSHAGLTPTSPRYPITLTDVVCDRNARQGLSWVGGTELTATRCRFNRTGRAGFHSGPGAGVDAEAESSVCRNGRFVECEFVDNTGVGFVAESGDVMNIRLERCRFVGTTSWSAWPNKPGILFQDCQFVGSIIHAFSDPDPKRATQFLSCRFTSDPRQSPTRQIYGEFLINLGTGGLNVLLSDCTLQAVSSATGLAWSPADTRYHSCRMHQAGPAVSRPRGIYTGTSRIDSNGPVDLAGSQFGGPVYLNGKLVS